ncbi:UQ_con domain-containing protein [Cephalotus follicularis]|uniref:UQ_con domain-containing protein n=1 Tax=Cephalotus follicularis TaxID=3775 RepID=A0A1Q3AVI4_CEPFO|nr:UQ_con domain-containing protein [Cephalotus follicularis]
MDSPKLLQFDAVRDHSDHWYADSKQSSGISNMQSEVRKKIMLEWKILEENLPESIYVRVYEKRIDLLRAMIIGTPHTPYHDGLFFFDIAFPSDYPNQPPLVRYRSYGLCINPNLYSDGYVCLSLLNTWKGKSNERWNPSSSTILQVLVSLQAIVLNDRPYYNEPGIKPAISWGAYNREVYGLNCKTMLHLLRKPPRNFEDMI